MISAGAGALAGTAQGTLASGIRSSPPVALAFMVLGAGGQAISNAMPTRDPTLPRRDWLASKWSPLQPLSDQEYEDRLREKMLRFDAEIAMIDDKIAALKEAKRVDREQGRPE